jgi:hypothetical protein
MVNEPDQRRGAGAPAAADPIGDCPEPAREEPYVPRPHGPFRIQVAGRPPPSDARPRDGPTRSPSSRPFACPRQVRRIAHPFRAPQRTPVNDSRRSGLWVTRAHSLLSTGRHPLARNDTEREGRRVDRRSVRGASNLRIRWPRGRGSSSLPSRATMASGNSDPPLTDPRVAILPAHRSHDDARDTESGTLARPLIEAGPIVRGG